jgi:hypothetical protein
LEALAGAKKDVPKEAEVIEMNSNDLDNKMGRNIGKRNRQDDNGSKTKVSNFISQICVLRSDVYVLVHINAIWFGHVHYYRILGNGKIVTD